MKTLQNSMEHIAKTSKVGLLYSFYSKKFKLILIKRPQTPVFYFLYKISFIFTVACA